MGIEKQEGIVAILDALGASSYDDSAVNQFLRSRERVFERLEEYLEEKTAITRQQLKMFTFNDTVVIALVCARRPPDLKQIGAFSAILRKFLVESMNSGLLFRGAAAIGEFRADDATNTIMGDAVTDAAQWYEQTEWVGVHYTPRSNLKIEHLMQGATDRKEWALLPYDVPVKGAKPLYTYAVNWPKLFKVRDQRPWEDDIPPKTKLLDFLSRHKVPLGTEKKYFNTVAFFDVAIRHTTKKQAAKNNS
jgi:hypothetical protein